MKYPHLKTLELKPLKKVKGGFELFKIKCCDCGLIHKMGFAVETNGNLGIALHRDNRATGQARRKKQKCN